MSSGFVTETELAEARQRRQEEWDKVRTPDQPEVAPEEPYDGRSLFDRLRDQKMKKDLEYEETHKLKNLIRGLDDDEAQFLELVDKKKCEAERQQEHEEQQELQQFRERVASLQAETLDKKIRAEVHNVSKLTAAATSTESKRLNQRALLSVAFKRQNGNSTTAKTSNATTESTTSKPLNKTIESTTHSAAKQFKYDTITTNKLNHGALRCVAILPGIGTYTDSSDSEISSGSDDDPDTLQRYDLVGRKQQKKKQCHDE